MDPIRNNNTPIPLNNDAKQLAEKITDAAKSFEKIFAQQMVEELTKDTFKTSDNAYGHSTAHIYRGQMIDSLANSLTDSGALGFADMLQKHWLKNLLNSNEQ